MVTERIKAIAVELGFELVGIADAQDPLLGEAVSRYERWLDSGHGASMEYLRRHTGLKAEPGRLLEGWKSVVCVGLLYGAEPPREQADRALVSLYTRGRDYHELITEKLKTLGERLRAELGIDARPFVDSEPVLERFWAWRAGLGWIGKNAMLINRRAGSFLFLGGVLTTAALAPDAPSPDHCGRCRKCIDACPTTAITDLRSIDSNKCIAFHTIENRGAVPVGVMERTGRWVAGCDICQTVCPWNDPVTPGPSFGEALNPAFDAPLLELVEWTADDFRARMKGVAMSRMKYAGFVRNLAIAVANSGLSREERVVALDRLASHASALQAGAGRDGAFAAIEWARAK